MSDQNVSVRGESGQDPEGKATGTMVEAKLDHWAEQKVEGDDSKYSHRFDTLYAIDQRYHLSEVDAELADDFENFGTRRVRVALVGVGRMGAIHLYNLLREPRALVLYILDNDWDRLHYMVRKYFLKERGVRVLHTDHIQKVLDDRSVEVMVISTPTFTHEKYTRDAIEHMKHVLCEKPLAESLEAVDSLVKLAIAKEVKLICAFQRRYDTSFLRVAEQIRRGDIGEPRLIKTCSRDSPLPPIEYIKISGGIFHDCFVHDLDVIIWYAQELPIEVHAYGHAYRDDYKELNDFDTAVICMKFKSELITLTDLTRTGPAGYEQRVEVYGPKGVLKIDELSRVGWEKHNEFGQIRPSQCYSFASRYSEAYSNEITEMFNHIEGNKVLHEIKRGHLQAMCKIVHSIEESVRLGRPVKITWTPEELELALS